MNLYLLYIYINDFLISFLKKLNKIQHAANVNENNIKILKYIYL